MTQSDEQRPDDSIESVTKSVARVMARKLDREIRGAWRAGYEWLHVYEELPQRIDDEQPMDFSISQHTMPTMDTDSPPDPEGLMYRYSYDLRELDRLDLGEHR